MKYVFQIAAIGIFTFAGEVMSRLLPLPIPGSIYGMLLLFVCLNFKIVRLDQIEETADFLLTIMPVLFIPASVSFMETYFQVRGSFLAILTISLISTIVVMAVTGLVTQAFIQFKEKRKNGKEKERKRESMEKGKEQ